MSESGSFGSGAQSNPLKSHDRHQRECRDDKGRPGQGALPASPVGDYAQCILDGQQRITSLYAIRKGIRLTRDKKEVDYRDIFIDLDLAPGEADEVVVTERKDGRNYVAVHDSLSKSSLFDFVSSVPTDKLQRLAEYHKMLTTFDFSTITIKGYPIEIACENLKTSTGVEKS